MPIPDFVTKLREAVGPTELWLSSATAVVIRKQVGGHIEVLLVRDAKSRRWTLVSGVMEPGERPPETVIREIREETGVEARFSWLAWMPPTELVTYDNGDRTRYLEHICACTWIAGEPEPSDDESIEAMFVSVEALPPMSRRQLQAIRIVLDDERETRFDEIIGKTS